MHSKYVAAFRAYRWSPDIALLADRFFQQCPNARHVVLLNEEKGEIDIGPRVKIAHGKDFDAFGLPERPVGQSAWFNSDYVYWYLRHRLPDYDYYLISESDVAVNCDVESIVQRAANEQFDALLHQVTPVNPNWAHYADALAQPDPLRCFLFICLFSARALDVFPAARRSLAVRSDSESQPWPIVESFVPTCLRDVGLKWGEIADFVPDTLFLRYRPFLALNDPNANRPNSLAHPVLGGADLARSLLFDQAPGDFFQDGTALREMLRAEPVAVVGPQIVTGFARHLDHGGVADMHARLTARGEAFPHHDDLAFAKPSSISSLSEWSRGMDVGLDASGANGAALHAECAFHTGEQVNAWWQVDLLEECVIDRIELLNRVSMPERFVRFALESRRDGQDWTIRHTKLSNDPVSSVDAQPWSIDFADPFVARFVRVRRLGESGFLHLRRVRIFGRGVRVPGPEVRLND